MEYRSLLNQSALDVDIDDITISGDHDGGFLHVHPSTGLIDPIVAGAQFSIAGDVLQLINLNSLNTGMLTEGVNLYYTDARSRGAISAGSGISYNSSTGVISSTGGGVLSISGTANQVLANGTSGSAQTGAVTLTLPQPIGITSAVRFGSIAVGTYSAYPLHIVSGNGYMLGDLSSTYAAQYVGVTSGGAEIRIYGDNGGNAHIGTITNHDFAFRTNDTAKMWLTKGGYFGIGVFPTTGVYLDVYSIMYLRDANAGLKITTSLGVNYIESASAGMSGSADLRFTDMNAANTWMTIKATTGYVGVGTTSPEAIMHIAKSGSGVVGPRIILDNTASPATNNQCEISFLTDSGATGTSYNANIKAVADGSGLGYTALTFGTFGGTSTPAERMRISPNGYVGIGTNNPQFPLHVKYSSAPQIVVDDNSTGAADIRHYVYGVLTGIHFANSTSLQLRSMPNIPLYLGYNSDIQVIIGDTTNGYPTAMTVSNQTSGPALKIRETATSGRGHIQIGSSSTASNNIHFGCEGDGAFYIWNGNWGAGSQKFCVNSGGNFRFDNNAGYNTSALYGVGGSYFTMYNTNTGGHSSQIGHDGANSYINNGAGGSIYISAYSAGYAALTTRWAFCQNGGLTTAYNSGYINFLAVNGSSGYYALHAVTGGGNYPLRLSTADDSGTHRPFQIGYYNSDNPASTWNSKFSVDGYNGNTTVYGTIGVKNAAPTLAAYTCSNSNVGACSSYANYSVLMYDSGSAADSYGNGIDSYTLWANSYQYHKWTARGTQTMILDGSGNLQAAGNFCVSRGKTIQFSASPTSLDDSIHSVNAYPYGIRISGANDGANHRNTQFGYYDAGTWQNRFDFDGYSGWFFIANRTSVPGTPSGGGVLYCESGALKYKGSSGTVTTIAPA